MWSWWKWYFYGAGPAHHAERCPFCGQTFDIRDPGQVLLHRDHLLAADASSAIGLPSQEEEPASLRKVVPFRRRHKG